MCSVQIFFIILRKAEFLVSSWKIAQAANPTRALHTHDNELQRASVIIYEELSGDWRPLFQYSPYNNAYYLFSNTTRLSFSFFTSEENNVIF